MKVYSAKLFQNRYELLQTEVDTMRKFPSRKNTERYKNYPMESIRSFDKDKNKTKDLFQDIHPSEKNNYTDIEVRKSLSNRVISKSE